MPTIQIADKPTLDNIHGNLSHKGYYHGEKVTYDRYQLPYKFQNGCAVVYNNEIHIIGGDNTAYTGYCHYKWDGNDWSLVSTTRYQFKNGCAVVYNNEIHILGSSNASNYTKHYKWDGETWVSVSVIPYNFYNGAAIVHKNCIYIAGGEGNNKALYKWDGTSWTQLYDLPFEFVNGAMIAVDSNILDHYICILGGSINPREYTLYDPGMDNFYWYADLEDLGQEYADIYALECDNKIYLIGSSLYRSSDISLLGSSAIKQLDVTPYDFYNGAAVVYNDEIYILGGEASLNYMCKYNRIKGQWFLDSNEGDNIYGNYKTIPFYENTKILNYDDTVYIMDTDAGYITSSKDLVVWDNTRVNTSCIGKLVYIYDNPLQEYDPNLTLFSARAGSNGSIRFYATGDLSGISIYEFPAHPSGYMPIFEPIIHKGELYVLVCYEESRESDIYRYDDSIYEWVFVSQTPYPAENAALVSYHDELHLIGGGPTGVITNRQHYKWDGESWTFVTTWSGGSIISWNYTACNDRVVIYNDELHMITGWTVHAKGDNPVGLMSYKSFDHYKFDGTGWVPVSYTRDGDYKIDANYYTDRENTFLFVLQGKLYLMMKSGYGENILKVYDDSKNMWGRVHKNMNKTPYYYEVGSTHVIFRGDMYSIDGQYMRKFDHTVNRYTEEILLPYESNESYGMLAKAVVLNDELHIFGGGLIDTISLQDFRDTDLHYKWDGESWTSVSTFPVDDARSALVYNNEIHIIGGDANSQYWMKWDGSTWTNLTSVTPGTPIDIVDYNGKLHMISEVDSMPRLYEYDPSDDVWNELPNSILPYPIVGHAKVWGGKIRYTGAYKVNPERVLHFNWDGSKWTPSIVPPFTNSGTDSYPYNMVIYKGNLYAFANNTIAYHDGLLWRDFYPKNMIRYNLDAGNSILYNPKHTQIISDEVDVTYKDMKYNSDVSKATLHTAGEVYVRYLDDEGRCYTIL